LCAEEAFDVLIQPQLDAILAGLFAASIGVLMLDLAAVQWVFPPPKALAASPGGDSHAPGEAAG
jgi:hypothetical protein